MCLCLIHSASCQSVAFSSQQTQQPVPQDPYSIHVVAVMPVGGTNKSIQVVAVMPVDSIGLCLNSTSCEAGNFKTFMPVASIILLDSHSQDSLHYPPSCHGPSASHLKPYP